MNFSLTDNQIMIRDSVRAFAEKELLPHYKHWDRSGEWLTQDYMKKIVDMGLLRLRLPEKFGGQGYSFVDCGIVCEEIDQHVPLELISPEWLLNASGEPQLLYIKKVKRLFDIVTSISLLVVSLPILLLAMLAVKINVEGTGLLPPAPQRPVRARVSHDQAAHHADRRGESPASSGPAAEQMGVGIRG